MKRLIPIACGALLLLCSAEASAAVAVRYAAPGGTGAASESCAQTKPCSLFNAASRVATGTALQPGDEVVVEPGRYSGVGDLGPTEDILVAEGVTVHGVAGQPRPVIAPTSEDEAAVFIMNQTGEVLRHLEIVASGKREPIVSNDDSVVDGVVARTSGRFACQVGGSVIHDSVCISGGPGGSAISSSVSGPQSPKKLTLRNVTAIATGESSHGLQLLGFGDVELKLDAVGVLARGADEDILASVSQLPPFQTGPVARIEADLDHSDFVEIKTETATGGTEPAVTAPGSGTNITAEPLLAADDFHELAGSPTIDRGATDAASGTTDIDGDPRVIGLPDIGADEFIPPSGGPTPPPPGAPATKLGKKPPRKTASPRATFTFGSDQAGARFECKLDRRPFKPCRSPFKAKALKPGPHSFRVRALNGAGLADPTPAVFRWRVLTRHPRR